MLARLKERAQSLIKHHGAEVGMIAKIVAHTLLLGAPMIIGATEALCDFVAGESES